MAMKPQTKYSPNGTMLMTKSEIHIMKNLTKAIFAHN